MLAISAVSGLRVAADHDLRGELKRRLPSPPRRLSSFMQLTLIGALDVLRGAPDRSWRVALGSATGAADDFAALIADYRAGELPMPLTFINSQAHIAGLYLAQTAEAEILWVTVGDTDGGGEEAQLWQIAAGEHADTLWGWVEAPLDGRPGRSDWLRLERRPARPPLAWIDCDWTAAAPAGAAPPDDSLYDWIAGCLHADADVFERWTPAGPEGFWRVRLQRDGAGAE